MVKPRPPKPPLHENIFKTVLGDINGMEERQVQLAKQPFTLTELLTMFIKREDRAVLTEAYRLCQPTGNTISLFTARLGPTEFGAPMVFVEFRWIGSQQPDGFFVSFYGSSREHPAPLQEDAPDASVMQFAQVVDDLTSIHYRFAQVRRVLHRLNDPKRCASLAALRYHWPCIVPLLHRAGCSVMAEGVEEPNARAGGGANLDHHLRKQLAVTNHTIASHFLLDDVPLPPRPPVFYTLHHGFKQS